MARITDWILDKCKESEIEAVVIGHFEGYEQDEWNPDPDAIPKEFKCVKLSWETAKRFLSYEFDDGFGGTKCHPVYVWTPTHILFISQYDGATSMCDIPRNPLDCTPYFPGG